MSLTMCPVGHVICPYNKSHVIRAERIQFHLTKCLPNAGDKPFVVCPFNSTHLIPSTDINNHKTNLCPDRNRLETFLYEVADTKPLFPVNKFEIESEENWDDAVEHTYNPEEMLTDRKVLVLKQVAPPAERKKFHAEQRRKFQTLSDEPISVAKNNKKPRQPNSKPFTHDFPKTVQENITEMQDEAKSLMPVVEKMENLTVTEQKKSDEFELVVGKKKNKKTNAGNQTNGAQPKKTEQKVKKPDALKEKISKENISEEPGNSSSKGFFSDEPKEDEFIVVTKKKNKPRKH